MDQSQSSITHQRRPALIPAGVELSPEDEWALRLRTGYVDPASGHGLVLFNVNLFSLDGDSGADNDNNADQVHMLRLKSAGKRKASALEEDEEV